jgi:F-type H+-transporting ATPase subunit gamma
MRMVAAARLQRLQRQVAQGRAYRDRMQQVLGRVAPLATEAQHPLLEVRQRRRVAVVIVAADKGLCGSYNGNVNRRGLEVLRHLQAHGLEPVAVTVGRRARDFLRFRGVQPARHYAQVTPRRAVEEARVISRDLRALYEAAAVDEIRLVYMRFITAVQHEPTEVVLLPLTPPEPEIVPADYIFEPEPQQLFARLLPRYVDTYVYHVLLEAATSEQGARMAAMTAATDNAEELLERLTRQRNRLRQESITREILEVVAGADVLAQAT